MEIEGNLSQTDGAAVIISVATFIERIAELTRAGGRGHQDHRCSQREDPSGQEQDLREGSMEGSIPHTSAQVTPTSASS
jgi:hypothetical protein